MYGHERQQRIGQRKAGPSDPHLLSSFLSEAAPPHLVIIALLVLKARLVFVVEVKPIAVVVVVGLEALEPFLLKPVRLPEARQHDRGRETWAVSWTAQPQA